MSHLPASPFRVGARQGHNCFQRHDQAPGAFAAQLPLDAGPGAAVPRMAGAVELCAGPSLGWQPVRQEVGDNQNGSTASGEALECRSPSKDVDLANRQSDLGPKAGQHLGRGRGWPNLQLHPCIGCIQATRSLQKKRRIATNRLG